MHSEVIGTQTCRRNEDDDELIKAICHVSPQVGARR